MKLTDEQAHLFVEMAKFGLCGGLTNIWEWYIDYQRKMPMFMVYEDIPAHSDKLKKMMVALIDDGGSFPNLTVETLDAFVDKMWHFSRDQHGNRP